MGLYRCINNAGSSSNLPFAFTKSGTLPDFTAANQEQSVDTGLSEIKYAYVEGVPTGYSTMLARAFLDTTKSSNKQIATNAQATNGTGTAVSSGTNATGVITAAGVQIKISAISGGTITVKTGNAANYKHINVKWYAG